MLQIKINNVRKGKIQKPVKLPSAQMFTTMISDRAVKFSFSPFEKQDSRCLILDEGKEENQTVDVSCCQSYIFILIG